MRRGVTLVTVVLAVLGMCCAAAAQVATTTIQDTVYRADGTPASGMVVVTWPTFTTAAGQAVAAGNTSATIGPNGALSLTLAPNANATPTGTYYTAVLHLDDGTTSQQYWVVPVSATPVTLAAVENQVLPSSVAMQTASRAYVDAKIAAVSGSGSGTTGSYVPTTGGTMTGPLVLPADPVTPNQAADKHYVDTNITQVTGGLAQKVSLVPTLAQTIAQPAGTQLGVNAFNGELFANGFQTGAGGNGIASALSSPGCGSGCTVVAEPNYNAGEPVLVPQIPNGGHVVDLRQGATAETFVNPLSKGAVAKTLSEYSSAPLNSGGGGFTLNLWSTALTGGTNQLPGGIESAPYGKSTYGVWAETGNYYTEGQHINDEHTVNCYAVGDCLEGSYVLTNSGGYRDWADEGAHPFDLDVTEDVRVFQGTCATGCTTGATSLFVNATSSGGTQGEGRFLIDKNPAKTVSTGQIVSDGGDTMAAIVNFSGTNFPASQLFVTAGAALSQATNIAPGTVTVPIATSGVPSGYSVNTNALPSTGVACVMDTNTGGRFPDFEMASYTVVDATHLSLTLNKAHASGALLAVGGMCGYGIEQTADTVSSIRQIFPIVGTVSPTSLYYASSNIPILGDQDYASTSGFANISAQVASISRKANVVTVTFTSNLSVDPNGLTMTVSGVADGSYNGSFQVTSTGSNQLTYANNGPDSTSSGGTVSYLNGSYILYPMAEVLSVYNQNTKQVDGQFTLGANTVQWAAGDAVEEPHFYVMLTSADTEFIAQYTPRPIQYSTPGKQYQGNVGPGMRGWVIQNAVPSNSYYGAGGTHQLPDDAYEALGVWGTDFEVDAGASSIIRAHCNLHGCNRWDSGYSLFDLDSAAGQDFFTYSPAISTMYMMLGGAPAITFAPNSISAGTVSGTTITGTTVTGGTVTGKLTSGSGAAGVFIINNHSSDAVQVQSTDAAGYSAVGFLDNTGAVAGGFGYSNPSAQSVPGTVFFTSVFHNMQFSTNNAGSAALTIDTAGNVILPGSAKVNSSGVISANQVSTPVFRTGTAANTDVAGMLTVSAGATTSSSYSFVSSYGSAPVCIVQPQSATAASVASVGAVVPQVSTTALSVSVQTAPASAITFGYVCVGRN
ncbi:MAG TPA: hypothetical protein VFA99_11955 [Acidobacteriaceae bacterium]|nr:hypothetical protein [Acidobacteriaceae bacterium]